MSSDPEQPYSLAQFLEQATAAIADIHSRSKLPVLAGGTGQYVRALLEGWKAPAVEPDPETRRTLEERAETSGVDSLVAELAEIDPEAAERVDARNVRRVVRALEVAYSGTSGRLQKEPPPHDVLVIGLTLARSALYERIDSRVDAMIASGWLSEVEGLLADGYGPELASSCPRSDTRSLPMSLQASCRWRRRSSGSSTGRTASPGPSTPGSGPPTTGSTGSTPSVRSITPLRLCVIGRSGLPSSCANIYPYDCHEEALR